MSTNVNQPPLTRSATTSTPAVSVPLPATRPMTKPVSLSTSPSARAASSQGRVATGGMMPTATGTMPVFADATHLSGAVVFHRDGIKVSRLIMPAGSELPAHTLTDDLVIVVVRGKGIIYAQQEPRHVEAGSVVDLVPGEEHSIDCFDEMELVITQVTLASRRDLAPPPPPAG